MAQKPTADGGAVDQEKTEMTHPLPEGAAYLADDGMRVYISERQQCHSLPELVDYVVRWRQNGEVHEQVLCQDDIQEPVQVIEGSVSDD